jgi:hypothetical protein
MNRFSNKHFHKAIKLSVLATVVLSLSGCIVALPPAIQLASLALDGVSYVTTGKSMTDHAMSTVTAQDCAMTHLLKGEDICSAYEDEIAILPSGAPALANPVLANAQDASRTTKSASLEQILRTTSYENTSDNFTMETASGPLF